MLVSTMVRFNAMNTANNAAFASVQASNSMINAVDNAHNFNGIKGVTHNVDKRFSLDLLTNKLLAKLSFLQENKSAQRKALDVII